MVSSRIARARIIPARAGFTQAARRPAGRAPDHPRSRGVYWVDEAARTADLGSSPLARGLPEEEVDEAGVLRIIPARAGFTTRSHSGRSTRRDHPRSRGVYRDIQFHGRQAVGSSPLARGLHVRAVGGDPVGRIIPARAGFTGRGHHRPRRGGDHPRSRGVYPCGSLESQRTRTLPDPGCLHCRPRARSAELR